MARNYLLPFTKDVSSVYPPLKEVIKEELKNLSERFREFKQLLICQLHRYFQITLVWSLSK